MRTVGFPALAWKLCRGGACLGAGLSAVTLAADLPGVTVSAHRDASDAAVFPATTATVSQDALETSINSVDVEDAIKYLPSLFVRKRNNGDTQPVLATRTWGLNSSARTLVYVDDVPISALIANNNTIGAPRWGVVSPEQIERVDMLYGPYSAEYSGNAMGGVLHIVTRAPQETELTVKQTEALQDFDLYGLHRNGLTSQTSATAGGRAGDLSWFLAGNFQTSQSQPLAYVTAPTIPAGTAGAVTGLNKLGQSADVLGAAGLLDSRMTNLSGTVAYDFASVWRASVLVNLWHNDTDSSVATLLTDGAGQPTFAGNAGFASNTYQLDETHLMTALALKSQSHGPWDGEIVATWYDFLNDRQRSPVRASVSGTTFAANGRLADLSGTGWGTLDLKTTRRALFGAGEHELSVGAHADRYTLDNPTYNTGDWHDSTTLGSLFASGRGRTQTQALWAQDRWVPGPDWEATLGLRAETWRASGGFNFSGTTAIEQPTESASALSPKASVTWRPADEWSITGSIARAVRFPTVAELYQLVATGSTYSSPNPALPPERDVSGEFSIEHTGDSIDTRVSLFQESTRDALIAQTATLGGYPVPVTQVTSVGELRSRGVELSLRTAELGMEGLNLDGSVTWVDSTILSNDSFSSASGSRSAGRRAPYVPRWRATLQARYNLARRWDFTLSGRYGSAQYSTVDESDTTWHVFGAFDAYLVIDARVHAKLTDRLSGSFGVDNLNNREYFLYHPFPQRTFVADLRATF